LLATKVANLEANISTLFATAKAEIARKDRRIAEQESELVALRSGGSARRGR
jgi:hypothetical protein